jgi:hypothetical protein
MKVSIFWDIKPCSSSFDLPQSGFLAYSPTLKMEPTYFSKISFDFNELHGVISQKTEVFKTFMGKYKVEA